LLIRNVLIQVLDEKGYKRSILERRRMMNQDASEGTWVVTFSPEDTVEDRLRKASHVKPSAAQLEWMEKEYIGFIHFGPNTFSGRQWGTGSEDPSDFNPKTIDPEQWVNVCAQAGMKMAIYTLKHHDGFCQWFTDTTEFSTNNSPVKIDIAKMLRKSCDNNQMELGVYLSPWDMHQRDLGLWNTNEYNKYFLAQLNELLSRYGSVKEVWFDGACGDYDIWENVPSYKPEEWYDYIESAQPDAVYRMYDPYIFASEEEWDEIKEGKAKLKWRGKAVRWVGNEEGKSRVDEWSIQPVFDRIIAENATFRDLGQEKYYQNAVGAVWYPVEVNTTILNQWFWNPETSKVKSVRELIDVYYNSIGNNGVLLLNISPDRNGVIPEDQIQSLLQLKKFIDCSFHSNLAAEAKVTASEEAPTHKAEFILDQDKMTYWTTDGVWDINRSSASITVDLGQCKTFDNVMVQEYIREGQRIAKWSFEIWNGDGWKEVVCHQTIGYKNIKRFDKVTTDRVRLNILRSWDHPMISNFGLYLADILEEINDELGNIQVGRDPISIEADELSKGIEFTYYAGGVQTAALIESTSSLKLEKNGLLGTINVSPKEVSIGYSISFQGYIYIPSDGVYSFQLESINGSVLILDGTLIVDNDEPHDLKSVDTEIILKAGLHPIKVLYTSFRQKGHLKVSWRGPGFEMVEVAAKYLYH
jgi:alpha-L-fucosidase